MKPKTKIASVVAAILAGVLVTTTAQALPTASAEAVLSVTNFQIINASTGVQVSATDFTQLSVTSTIQTVANYPGTSPTLDGELVSSFSGQSLVGTAQVGIVPISNGIVPIGTAAASLATPTTLFNAPMTSTGFAGNFAASGGTEVGSPISNFPNSTSPVASNADVNSGAYASLDTIDGVAGTTATNNLSSSFTFATDKAGALRFNFDIGAYIGAYLTAGAAQFAQANWSVTFTLRETGSPNNSMLIDGLGNVLQSIVFGDNVSNNKPGTGTIQFGSLNSSLNGAGVPIGVARSFTSAELSALTSYTLTIDNKVAADVSRIAGVPEPDILALLGIGLLGMVFASRKFKTSSSMTYA